MNSKEKIWTIGVTSLIAIIAILAVFPLFSLFISSLRPSSDLMRSGITLSIPFEKLNLNNYTYIFSEAGNYWDWYLNSLIISAFTIALCLFFSSMVGYALAVYEFKGNRFIFILVLLILMIPFEILMLPLYQFMIKIQMVDTYLAVILPMIVAPVAVFFFRQYASGLPKDLMESARMDGCTEYGIFFRIMAPLMLPSFAAMAILQGLSSWNNFLWPLVVLRSNSMFTLPVGLATLLTPYGNNYDVLIAGSVMTVLPVIILFLFFQRFFIEGLTVGGVKG
ncbi:carbohydrate ABC transporter permease [Domibacillus sp. DTU_2020_1001157_1_SI_ALB_TIR_016]|uniref:carbohydrate ABC transporter permease n=1 Tax=Domibacillus sp. DTU_2020_1001157_1_SI_ALB_TIR_016 TaxID=3077789 RepID=UPI0028E26B23|nr:carbohydrate ABC transporter permease [Domibacillus sp. DTU_2020_1001157_1_SI_ALB_TIR_016]WNS77830.1 carbohydrate ABC transporter permease [Domibacillus sp. DTU_2020_1001157_1_SI_ALB_TIR_016]